MKRGLGIAALVVLAATTAFAGEKITIELRSGDKVTGELESFGDRVYRVKIGGQSLSFKESDVKKIEFGEPAKAETPKPDVSKPTPPKPTKPFALDEIFPTEKELPKGLTLVRASTSGEAEIANGPKLFPQQAEILADAIEMGLGTYSDGGRAEIYISAIRYKTDEAEAKSEPGQRRSLLNNIREECPWIRSGPVRVFISPKGAHPEAVKALVELVDAKLFARFGFTEQKPLQPRTRAPLEDAKKLLVPKPWLPDGLAEGTVTPHWDVKDAAPVACFGAKAIPDRVVYSTGPGQPAAVVVHVYAKHQLSDEADYAPTGTPSADDLKPFHAVWVGEQAAVTVWARADVQPATVAAIETQLAKDLALYSNTRDLKPVKGPAAKLPPAPRGAASVLDLLGSLGDVPGMTRGRPRALTREEPGVLGPLAYTAGKEVGVVEYTDRGKVLVLLARMPDDGATGVFIERAKQDAAAGTARAALVIAGHVVALILDRGAVAASVEELRSAVGKVLALGAGSATTREIRTAAPALDIASFTFPKELLPGVSSVEVEEGGALVQPPTFAGVRFAPGRAIHRTGPTEGIEVSLWPQVSSSPTVDEMSSYRYVWRAGQAVWNGVPGAGTSSKYSSMLVALRVMNAVPERVVAAFVALVRAELARLGEGAVRQLKGEDAATVPATAPGVDPEKLAPADLLPAPSELPAGFSVSSISGGEPGKLGDLEHDGYVFATYQERGQIEVRVYRSRGTGVTFEPARRNMLGRSEPGEILEGAGFVIAVIEKSSTTAAGRAALTALFGAKLEKLHGGSKVRYVPIPIERPKLDLGDLRFPQAVLPEGVTVTKNPESLIGEFGAVKSSLMYVYSVGSADVRVIRFATNDGQPIGMPTPEELRPLHAAWVATTQAVAIQLKGAVPAAVVTWFEKSIEAELRACADTRTAKRVEIPAPKVLSAADIVPQVDEVPSGLGVVKEEKRTQPALYREVEHKLEQSPTTGPVFQAMNAGARDVVAIAYRETHRDRLLRLEARSYDDAVKATAALAATKRAVGTFFTDVREILLVENVVCVLEDHGATVPGWETFRKAILKRAEGLGEVRAETFTLAVRAEPFAMTKIPPRWLPAGWKSIPNHSAAVPGAGLGETACSFGEVCGDGKGQITVLGFELRERFEPSAPGLRALRDVWILEDEKTGFAIRTSGEVAKEVVAHFVAYLAKDIERCTGGKAAKHYDASTLPPPWKAAVGQVFVYSETKPDGQSNPHVLIEIVAWGGAGGQCTYLAWPEGGDRAKAERKTVTIDTRPLREGEESVKKTISGVPFTGALQKSGDIRALDPLLPLPLKVRDDDRWLELVEIRMPVTDLGAVGIDGATFTLDSDRKTVRVTALMRTSKADKAGLETSDRLLFVTRDADGKRVVIVERGSKELRIRLDD